MNKATISCPHCQQHIECSHEHAGLRISCPSCHEEMVVPADLFASRVKIRQASLSGHSGAGSRRGAKQGLAGKLPMIVGISVAAVVVVIAFLFLKPIISRSLAEDGEHVQAPAANNIGGSATSKGGAAWTLDLQTAEIPDSTASASVAGTAFSVNRSALTVGGSTPVLSLRAGANEPYREILVQFPRRMGTSLDGQKLTVNAQDKTSDTKVVTRWEAGGMQLKTFDTGFALRVEFGRMSGGLLPGKIYLAIPDAQKSYVAGEFRAVLQATAPQTTSAPGTPSQLDKPQRGPASVILKQRARQFGEQRREE